MPPANPEIVVVGAGAAGIAAARELAALGRSCVVLEAAPRVGGRAFTESDTLGAPFDHGASWLHQAGDNPLTPLARDLGIPLVDHDTLREYRTFDGGRLVTPEERAAYDAAWDRFERAAAARAAPEAGPDLPLADVVPQGGLWDATVGHWVGPIISAAELAAISLRDWHATLLGSPNLLPEPGVGALLRRLAEGLPIALGTPVTRLRWGGPAGVVAEGPRGSLAARAAIVTVPTAVLAAGAIAFDPPLPAATQETVAALPLGLLTKVALRAAGEDRLCLPPFAGLERRVEGPDDHPITWVAWPFGRDHLIGFIGGARAWDLAGEPSAAAEAFARAELARLFGARAIARALRPEGQAVVTRWAEDPLARGAYSHARPGHAGARAALAAPLAGGRLTFAGEACHTRFAGTVGGAWDSGRAAARAVAAALA